MTNDTMTPEDALAALRQSRTNRYIAGKLGVHEVTVARWANGTRQITNWTHADKLRRLVADEAEKVTP